MKLGIISDAHHYYDSNGKLCTLALLARQFEQWATFVDQIIICAPLLMGSPPALFEPYRVPNIHLFPVENAGGNSLPAKINLLRASRSWWKTINEFLASVDAVHIRCPNNISIPGLIALHRTSLLRQALYTGSWERHPGEPISYSLQRFYLKHYFKGPVTIYGEWQNQPGHIIPSFSPSYSIDDWNQESSQVSDRLNKLRSISKLGTPLHLVTIGALNCNKNQSFVINAVHGLFETGLICNLDIIGDGVERTHLEKQVETLGIERYVFFHGNVPHNIVRQFYRQADFVIQAPFSEGFGKVPIEAMFHGVIPIISDVDISSQIIGNGKRGRCFQPTDINEVIKIIQNLQKNPSELAFMIQNGRDFAKGKTLEAWKDHLKSILSKYWDITLQ